MAGSGYFFGLMSDRANVLWFCRVAFWEGLSYLLLLGIAMPLKYLADYPQAVRWVGMAHGVLFIAYALYLLVLYRQLKWSIGRVALYFLASLLPIAPFIVERRLKAEHGLA